jgi:hypothetical protein
VCERRFACAYARSHGHISAGDGRASLMNEDVPSYDGGGRPSLSRLHSARSARTRSTSFVSSSIGVSVLAVSKPPGGASASAFATVLRASGGLIVSFHSACALASVL